MILTKSILNSALDLSRRTGALYTLIVLDRDEDDWYPVDIYEGQSLEQAERMFDPSDLVLLYNHTTKQVEKDNSQGFIKPEDKPNEIL